MSELVFTFHNEPWEIALHLNTSFTREFGEETADGWVAFDFSTSTFEMVFGLARQTAGAPILTLDTANGDLVPGPDGALTFNFVVARLAALAPDVSYIVDINRIQGSVPMPFGRGKVVTYAGPKA